MKAIERLIPKDLMAKLPRVDAEVSRFTTITDLGARKTALKEFSDEFQKNEGRKPKLDWSKAQPDQQAWFTECEAEGLIENTTPKDVDKVLREIDRRIILTCGNLFAEQGGLFAAFVTALGNDTRPIEKSDEPSKPGDHIRHEFLTYTEGAEHGMGRQFGDVHYWNNIGLDGRKMEGQNDTEGIEIRRILTNWLADQFCNNLAVKKASWIVDAEGVNPLPQNIEQAFKLALGLLSDLVRTVWYYETASIGKYPPRAIGKELLETELPE